MPDRRSPCPGFDRLVDYRALLLDEPGQARIALHVEACAACRRELDELALDDRFAVDLARMVPQAQERPRTEARVGEAERESLLQLLGASDGAEQYEITGELGRGGMGVVYEVRDRVLHRVLAMKVAHAGPENNEAGSPALGRRLSRFLEEARITAQLDHPAIIPVHELGVDGNGRAFFTMTKVRGRDLRGVFEEHRRGAGGWTLPRLVAAILGACDALAFAHSKRVVHRDLKPANVMLGRFSEVYVMDWGVAKVVGERGTPVAASDETHEASGLWSPPPQPGADAIEPPVLTIDGEVVGTPAYMSPEQARGQAESVGLRADVYSMGAVLYELLSGRRPYDSSGNGAGARTPPYEAWQRVLAGPPTPLIDLAPSAPPELAAICARAMERDPSKRYADMGGLAADLRAWLEGRVVSAHRTGVAPEFKKWVARNRALTFAASLALLALIATAGLLARQSVVEARGRTAVTRAAEARRMIDEDPALALRLAIEMAEDDENHLARTLMLGALVPLAQDAFLTSDLVSATWMLEDVHRSWSPTGEIAFLEHMRTGGPPRTLRFWDVHARRIAPDSFVTAPAAETIAFDAEGRRVALGGLDGSLAIYDRATGASLVIGGGKAHAQRVSRVCFAPDGVLLASASWDGTAALWDTASGALVRRLEGHAGIVTSVEFDARGERLLSASGPPRDAFESDRTARLWDVPTGAPLLVFAEHSAPITSARFDPAGERVLSASYDRTVLLWEARSGTVERSINLPGVAWTAEFSADGATLAVAFDSGFLVQEVASGREERFGPFEAHDGRAVVDVRFSPRGDRLLTVANDRVARVWALEAGKRPRLIRSLAGHVGPTNYGAWSPDGLAIVVREQTGLRVWLAQGNATIDDARPEPSPATHARFHPAGDRVLLTFESGPAHEIGFTPGAGLGVDRALGDRAALDVAATADGELVLVAEAGGPVRVWRRVDGGALVESRTLTLDALSLHPAETGTLLGLRLAAGGVAVVDLASDAVHRFAEGETVNALDLSADAARLVLGTESGSLRVYLVADGRLLWNEQIAPVSLINTGILAVAFAGPTRVLSAGPFKDVVVRDAATGRVERTVTETTIGAMIALRDGERLLTRSQWGAQASVASLQADGLPRMLRSPANRETHRNRLTDWAIDAAQRRLLTTSLDRVANVWDVARGEAWATYSGHADPVLAGDLSRDGEWAVTADSSGAVHVWPTDPLRWARAAVLAEPAPGAR